MIKESEPYNEENDIEDMIKDIGQQVGNFGEEKERIEEVLGKMDANTQAIKFLL